MVNIEDIRKRLARNPEPAVVTEARQRIKDSFGDIIFNEEEHRYFLPKADGALKELTSVSNMVEKFVPYVDWDAKCAAKAERLGIPTEQLSREWYEHNHLATTSGSVVHEYGEMWHHMLMGQPEKISDRFKIQYEGGYLFPASPKQEAAMKFNEYMFSLDNIYTVEAEARVYCEELGYSGTFDRLSYIENKKDPSKSGFGIADYKTNASLLGDYARSFNQRMLPPFDCYIDEALSHYYVQLSMYQICLENIGLKVIDRCLVWLRTDGEYELVRTPDLTKVLRETLKNMQK